MSNQEAHPRHLMATLLSQKSPGLGTPGNKDGPEAWQHVGITRYENASDHTGQSRQQSSSRTRQTSIPRPGSKQQNGHRGQSLLTSQKQPDHGQKDHRSSSEDQYPRLDHGEPDDSHENGSGAFVNGKTIRRVGSQEGTLPLDEEDWNSRWIHRDKLAMIEIQEMQEAGIPIPFHRYVNGNSARDSNASAVSQNHDATRLQDEDWHREQSRTPDDLVYSSQSQDEEEGVVLPDPRTPEEIAADPYERGLSMPAAHAHNLRASSSRIPLSTSSPVPIPVEHIERSIPLPRKRGASGGPEDLMFHKTRRRSRSVGSTTMFDDGAGFGNTSPPTRTNRHSGNSTASPRLSSANQKFASPGTPQNTSAHKRDVSSGQRSRTPSAPLRGSPAQRPATRSGLATRPATAVNRPEGEAPWIATMFKPDPMLPPEQQLLPTYAKRLQQEQWEKEGKSGSAFDKNFNPTAIQQDRERPAFSSQEQTLSSPNEADKGKDVPASWPLTSPQESNSPKTPSSEHAGYRTIPRVHSTPSIAPVSSPRLQAPQSQSNVQKPEDMESLKVEEGKKDRGCGCCIVM